jgi:hypothetical protein
VSPRPFDLPGGDRLRDYVAASLIAIICFIPAFRLARTTVRGVSEPYDLDQFRDIAAAQSMADGRFPSDPCYRSETFWYNPLLPGVVAGLSRASGLQVAATEVQAGPVLNAFSALAFFLMAALLVGPWAGLAAFTVLLYSPPYGDPAWATPSYSPWLFASTFAAGFFYCAVVGFTMAIRRGSCRWWALAGVALGITFLAHTGPALVLGIAMLPALLSRRRPPVPAGSAAAPPCGAGLRIAVVAGFALIVAAPLLWSIVWKYHLRIVNRAPTDWVWAALASVSAVVSGSLNAKNAIGAIGTGVLAYRSRRDVGARVALAWFVSAAVLLSYGYAAQAAGPGRFPPLIPMFHFFFYLRSVVDLFVGVGLWALICVGVAALGGWVPFTARRVSQLAAAVLIGVTLLWSRPAFHQYRDRADFGLDRLAARRFAMETSLSGVRERLRLLTPADAVVLASPDISLRIVAASGRYVVAVPPPFSNPYVPYAPRASAQSRMLAALSAGETSVFSRIASEYGVTHVLLSSAETVSIDERRLSAVLRELSRQGGFVLLAVQ